MLDTLPADAWVTQEQKVAQTAYSFTQTTQKYAKKCSLYPERRDLLFPFCSENSLQTGKRIASNVSGINQNAVSYEANYIVYNRWPPSCAGGIIFSDNNILWEKCSHY